MRVLDKRHYSGQEDAALVAQWLNARRTGRGGRGIQNLVADLTALCSTATPWEARLGPAESRRWRARVLDAPSKGGLGSLEDDPHTWPLVGRGLDYSKKAMDRVRSALACYSFQPFLRVMRDIRVCEECVKGRPTAVLYGADMRSEPLGPNQRFAVVMRPVIRRGVMKEEAHVVLHVMNLVEAGLIDRVRQCSCGKWFFAHNIQMRHHAARCRQRDYKSTPEWREKRNRYMREYYRKFQSPKSLRSGKKGK